MSHDQLPDDFPFSGLEPPGPPPELRGKVLALAREALARESTRDVWTRIWENRPLRLAWAVAASLLLIANISVEVRRPTAGVAVSRAEGEKEAARELAVLVALPPIDERVQPLVGRAAANSPSPEEKSAIPPGGLS